MAPTDIPSSVLFCCDYNSIRSPMAEGLMKKFYGTQAYVQSAGVKHDLEIDGFAVAVCSELGVELERHQARSFDEMQEWGDDLSGFDLIVALSPASQRRALDLTRHYHLDIEYWPVSDPAGTHSTREAALHAYRKTRDQIIARLWERFGPVVDAAPQPQADLGPAVPSYPQAVDNLRRAAAEAQHLIAPIAKQEARRGHNNPPTPLELPWIDWIALNDTLSQMQRHLDLDAQDADALQRAGETLDKTLKELRNWAQSRAQSGIDAVIEKTGDTVQLSAAALIGCLVSLLEALRVTVKMLRA